MNSGLSDLQEKITYLKREKKPLGKSSTISGYTVMTTMLTDLISCLLIGLALGLFLQRFFHTSVLWTASLVLLGGIAGLWTASYFAVDRDKRKIHD